MATPPNVQQYNRPSFTSQDVSQTRDPSRLDFQPNLHVGMMAPDFEVTDLEGNKVRLSDFRGKKHVLFEFGCITAPVFINDITSLNRLHGQYQDKDVQFLIIYAREAHAGENYAPHTSFEQKVSYARDLKRLENVQFPVLVDSLDGAAHHVYGLRPSPVYLVNKDGRIIYKASWLVPDQLQMVLEHLMLWEQWKVDGGRPPRNAYSEIWTALRINPDVHERVFARTGGQARDEVARAFGYDIVKAERKEGTG